LIAQDRSFLLPRKGIRSGISGSGSKVVWVHFLSTLFEDAKGWALTYMYTGSGPELIHFGPLLRYAGPSSVHFASLRPTSAHFCHIPRTHETRYSYTRARIIRQTSINVYEHVLQKRFTHPQPSSLSLPPTLRLPYTQQYNHQHHTSSRHGT
jgi:hypothetical protein